MSADLDSEQTPDKVHENHLEGKNLELNPNDLQL